MAKVTWKAKPMTFYNSDETVHSVRVPIPREFTSAHYRRSDFHNHPKLAALSNSDMMPNAVKRAVQAVVGNGETMPLYHGLPGVTVDRSKFLAVITVEI